MDAMLGRSPLLPLAIALAALSTGCAGDPDPGGTGLIGDFDRFGSESIAAFASLVHDDFSRAGRIPGEIASFLDREFRQVPDNWNRNATSLLNGIHADWQQTTANASSLPRPF